MPTTQYEITYDVLQQGLSTSVILVLLVVLIMIAAGLAFLIDSVRKRDLPRFGFSIVFFVGVVFTGGSGALNVVAEQLRCVEWARAGNFQIVEGVITNFSPMPYEGHQNEQFTVNGVTFKYSDYDLSQGGFNQTASHGGPIREGLRVRIAYKEGRVLKLEIAK